MSQRHLCAGRKMPRQFFLDHSDSGGKYPFLTWDSSSVRARRAGLVVGWFRDKWLFACGSAGCGLFGGRTICWKSEWRQSAKKGLYVQVTRKKVTPKVAKAKFAKKFSSSHPGLLKGLHRAGFSTFQRLFLSSADLQNITCWIQNKHNSTQKTRGTHRKIPKFRQ